MSSIPIVKRKITQGGISFDSKTYRNQRLRGLEGMEIEVQVEGRRLVVYNPAGHYVCGFDRQGILDVADR